MELILLSNTSSFSTQIFTSGETILKAEVEFVEGDTRIISGNSSCEEYRTKIFHGQTNCKRRLCIHIKRNPDCPDDWEKCIVRVHGCFWQDLNSLWLEGLKIRVVMGFCILDGDGDQGMSGGPPVLFAEISISRSLYTSHFPIDPVNEACIQGKNFAEVQDVEFDYHILLDPEFGEDPDIHAREVISLIADGYPQHARSTSGGELTQLPDTEERAFIRINRKILDSKIHSDVVIVAKDGSVFDCNKTFLAAHSPVFATMLEVDMKEAKTNRIEMQDMTQSGVKALLDYIYTFEVDQAIENVEIALELLQAGHKYDIKSLEKQISSILLEKNVEFFTVDVAFGLFLFAKKVYSMKDLKSKAVAALMAKPKEFLASAAFKKMHQENHLSHRMLFKNSFYSLVPSNHNI